MPREHPLLTRAPDEHRLRVEREAGLALDVAVLTVSDSRTEQDDDGGELILSRVRTAGHRVARRDIRPDEPEAVREFALEAIGAGVHVLITTGGTGIARRDSTIEVIEPLLSKSMDGFGELFRMLSFEEVGAAAMLSRALAGVSDRTLVFCLPGSPAAVELALDKLVLPDLAHLAWEATRR